MPLWEYETQWKSVMEKYGLFNIFLITPQTPEDRIWKIDSLSSSFIYMVSSASVTGAKTEVSDGQRAYFQRVNQMNLKSPTLIGFGISSLETFRNACQYSQGAIIGSAFIKVLEALQPEKSRERFLPIRTFIEAIKA
jgi:tryptophan synthase alpha chain